LRVLFLSVFVLFTLACGTQGPEPETTTTQAPETSTPDAPKPPVMAEWGYSGDIGPENWGSLSEAYALCDSGTQQSPIDFSGDFEEAPAALELNYGSIPLRVVNTGSTIKVNTEGHSIITDGNPYNLIQFHFHHRSEHTQAGQDYPMDLHLVHQNADGNLAVVGVFFTEGEANAAIQAIWENIPEQGAGEKTAEGVTISLMDLLPENQTYYTYSGSLTTPGCNEGVAWHHMTEPIEVSAEQIAAFGNLYPTNSRPVQPLGDRTIRIHQ